MKDQQRSADDVRSTTFVAMIRIGLVLEQESIDIDMVQRHRVEQSRATVDIFS